MSAGDHHYRGATRITFRPGIPLFRNLAAVELLKRLLSSDGSVPRLTAYDETTGGRTDLTAVTLDNWASKIANMLHDEFDLDAGDTAWIDLPEIWQAACLVLGTERAGVELSPADPMVVFTTSAKLSDWEAAFPEAYLAVVTDDVFGRGVVETGGSIPPGVIDFGPEVRMYPDAYLGSGAGPEQPLIDGRSAADLTTHAAQLAAEGEFADAQRIVTNGWGTSLSAEGWMETVLAPWTVGGAAVIVRGATPERMAQIADIEKASVVQRPSD